MEECVFLLKDQRHFPTLWYWQWVKRKKVVHFSVDRRRRWTTVRNIVRVEKASRGMASLAPSLSFEWYMDGPSRLHIMDEEEGKCISVSVSSAFTPFSELTLMFLGEESPPVSEWVKGSRTRHIDGQSCLAPEWEQWTTSEWLREAWMEKHVSWFDM